MATRDTSRRRHALDRLQPAPGTAPSPGPTRALPPLHGLAAHAALTIDDVTFSPPAITLPAGTRITWAGRDDIPHTVTRGEDPKTLKSPPLDTGEALSFTFTRSGTYHCFCSLHPRMEGSEVLR